MPLPQLDGMVVEEGRRQLTRAGGARHPSGAGKRRDHRRADRTLQIDGQIVAPGLKLLLQPHDTSCSLKRQRTPLPGARRHSVDPVHQLGVQTQQRRPARFNRPADRGSGTCPVERMAQGKHGRQRMQHVSHGADADDQDSRGA